MSVKIASCFVSFNSNLAVCHCSGLRCSSNQDSISVRSRKGFILVSHSIPSAGSTLVGHHLELHSLFGSARHCKLSAMLLPLFLQRWILLNTVRLFTIVSCSVVIGSTIRTLKINFQHYPPAPTSASSTRSAYHPSTDIPTTFLGVFWSTLHHISTCVVLLTVMVSELSLPIPLVHRLFKNTLPFLGPNWGTACLGVLLILVAADGLSRGQVGGRFAEISAWTLASMGVANVGVGVVWRAKAKVVRSWSGWKAEVAEKLERLADAKRDAERVVDELPFVAGMDGKGGKRQAERGAVRTRLKRLIGLAGKKVAQQIDKCQPKKEDKRQEHAAENELEKRPTSARNLSIFTPPLPSVVVKSRVVHTPPLAPTTEAAAVAASSATTKLPPPLMIARTAAFGLSRKRSPSIHSISSTCTCSTYTFDMRESQPHALPFTNTPILTTTDSPPIAPHEPLSPSACKPTLRTVRFHQTCKVHHPSTTIESLQPVRDLHRSSLEAVNVDGSNFHLLTPSPLGRSHSVHLAPPPLALSSDGTLLQGERSPWLVASLKAAMLQAQAKAGSHKKPLYLGSHRWKEEYEAMTSAPCSTTGSDDHDHDHAYVESPHTQRNQDPIQMPSQKPQLDARPYHFL